MSFFARSELREETYVRHCGRDRLERTPAACANHVSGRPFYAGRAKCVFTLEQCVFTFALAP